VLNAGAAQVVARLVGRRRRVLVPVEADDHPHGRRRIVEIDHPAPDGGPEHAVDVAAGFASSQRAEA